MTEEARDKAVEEALETFWEYEDVRPEEREAMRLLWQRAQKAEREECCKAVCFQCADGVTLAPDGENHIYDCPAGQCDEHPEGQYTLSCAATPIRNRSAARASEEPKP